ncbi:MAG: 4-alpha-glucanotransferase, partial [Acidimicrobiales bacterium]
SLLTPEDGGEVELAAGDALPPDLPLGYHSLTRHQDGRRTAVIVSPGRCLLPPRPAWGWALQLYAARSAESWGIGDLADLRRLTGWSERDLGAGLVLVNPLHAALPGEPQTASPYFPSSRRFRNPLYLRVEEVPGANEVDLGEAAAAGRALNAERLIDRDAVYRLKMGALARLWERFPEDDPAFGAYCTAEGSSLEDYGTFCALAEEFGRPWLGWPAEYRHPAAPGVARYRREHLRRVRFHMWLQWLIDRQLDRASDSLAVLHDLAIGVDLAGADTWLWQDLVVAQMRVGAPPDEFNRRGQDWGVPPFDPWKLRAAGYGPFIETVRSTVRHGGGMRADHVMGLFRLFWVPRGASPAGGTYVRYPAGDLLDIVALESHRAGAFVVGEDLGTVEEHVRAELAARNVLSYRLLWFERDDPERWPGKALAAVSTHDLPTVAGLWTGADLEAQKKLDLDPNQDGAAATREHLRQAAGVDGDAPTDEAMLGAYAALARTPCLLLAATLDDALGVEERPNIPGITDEWPNWSIALPQTLEEIERDPRPRRVADLLRRPE